DEEQKRHVGKEPAGHGKVELQDGVDPQPACDSLVGERGVDVPVADHVGTALEGRPDHLFDMLGARGGEERGLGPGPHRRPVEDECAHSLAELGATRLAREDDVTALRGESRAQKLRLRRLARAVGSLEGHEHEPPRYAAAAREGGAAAGRANRDGPWSTSSRSPAPPPGAPARSQWRFWSLWRLLWQAESCSSTGRKRPARCRRPAVHPSRRRCPYGHAPASRCSSSTATESLTSPGTRRRSFSPAAIATPSRPTRRASSTRARSSCSGAAGNPRPSGWHATSRSPRLRRSTATSDAPTRTSRSS